MFIWAFRDLYNCRNNTPPGVAFRVSHIAYSSAQRKGASLAVSVDRFGLGNLFLQVISRSLYHRAAAAHVSPHGCV